MVNFIRIYRNNEYTLLSLEEYLNEYNKELPEGWYKISHWVNKIFEIQTELEYDTLTKEIQVENIDISKMKEGYTKLKSEYPIFDDDILMFISVLLGTSYFSKIGNPTLDQWLNAIDINHPFKEKESVSYGFSFKDVIQYRFGQNAIRKNLLSTLRWISSQGGS